MKTVYLAGPMTGLSFVEANAWRVDFTDRILSEHNIKAINPFRGKEEFLKDDTALKPFGYTHVMATDIAITTRDRHDTQTSDVVLMNFLGADKVSAGSMVEMGWADSKRIPIVVVMEESGNPHDHCMVRAMAGYRVSTLDDALVVIGNIIGRDT